MTCAELELLLCDYVDGTLAPARKAEVEQHLSACPACAELTRDSAAAVGFMERAAVVEPPPELVTRILFEHSHQKLHVASGPRRWVRRLFDPLLQPRFAMGMAMTILSFAMLARFVSPVRQLRVEDLQPSKIWATLDDRVYRTWQRTVKFYENIRLVYQIQSRVREWQQQQEDEQRMSGAGAETSPGSQDKRRLPVGNPPAAAPEGKEISR